MVRRLAVDIRHCVCNFQDCGRIFNQKEIYNCTPGRQCRIVYCNGAASLPSRAPQVLERCLPEMILEGAIRGALDGVSWLRPWPDGPTEVLKMHTFSMLNYYTTNTSKIYTSLKVEEYTFPST